MKAILEFSLPEESQDHLLAINGGKWMGAVHEFDQWLRTKIKYENQCSVGIVEARSKINELLLESGLSFE